MLASPHHMPYASNMVTMYDGHIPMSMQSSTSNLSQVTPTQQSSQDTVIAHGRIGGSRQRPVRNTVMFVEDDEAVTLGAHRQSTVSATSSVALHSSIRSVGTTLPYTPFTPATPPPPVPEKDGPPSMMQAMQEAFLAAGRSKESLNNSMGLSDSPQVTSPLPLEATQGLEELEGRWTQTPSPAPRTSYTTRVSHDTASLFGLERTNTKGSYFTNRADGATAGKARLSSGFPASSGESEVGEDLADLASIVAKLDDLPCRLSMATLKAKVPDRSSMTSSEGMITIYLDCASSEKTKKIKKPKIATSRSTDVAQKALEQGPPRSECADELEADRLAFLAFQDAERLRIEGLERKERQRKERQRMVEDELKRDSVLKMLEVEQRSAARDRSSSRSSATPSRKARSIAERPPPSEPLPPAPRLSTASSHLRAAVSHSTGGATRATSNPSSPPTLSVPDPYSSADMAGSRQRSASDGNTARAVKSVSPTSPRPPPSQGSSTAPPSPVSKSESFAASPGPRLNLKTQRNPHQALADAAPSLGSYGMVRSSPLSRQPAKRAPSYRVPPPIDRQFEVTARAVSGDVQPTHEGDWSIASDKKHGGSWLVGLPSKMLPSDSPHSRQGGHSRQVSTSSTTSQHSSLLESRRERNALEEAGLDGTPWIAKVLAKASIPHDLSDDDNSGKEGKMRSLRRRDPPPHIYTDLSSPTGSSASSKALPQPPPMTPTLAAKREQEACLANLARKEQEAEEARRRAQLAEQSALEQVRIARELQVRLETELAEVSKRGRERSEAELVARAQWAREQATRNMLDAFERSKLESEERKRRLQVEMAKREEDMRAREVAKEREEAVRVQKEAMEEAQRRLRDLTHREEKLMEEREARKREEEAQADRRRKIEEQREANMNRFRDRLKCSGVEDIDLSLILKGWAQVQLGEGVRWKRRFFTLRLGSLDLFKDEAGALQDDSLRILPRPLDRLDLARVSVENESEDAYEVCQMPCSCMLRLASSSQAGAGEDSATDTMVTLSFDDEAAREDFVAALTVIMERRGEKGESESPSAST